MIINDNGVKRFAYAKDFEDVTIIFTAEEWQELKKLFEFRLQTKPSTESKTTGKIYKKIKENTPKLKSCYKEITDCVMDD